MSYRDSSLIVPRYPAGRSLITGILLCTGGFTPSAFGPLPAHVSVSHVWVHIPAEIRKDTGASGDTLAAQLATITTDTGAFAPGHRDFSRYTTPNLCVAAANAELATVRRSLAAQESRDTLAADTVGVGAIVPLARACGARFALATTPRQDLMDLFDLAVFEQQAPLAHTVFTQLLAQNQGSQAKELRTVQHGFKRVLQVGWWALADSLLIQAVAALPADTTYLAQVYASYRNEVMAATTDSARVDLVVAQGLRWYTGLQSHLDFEIYRQERHLWEVVFRRQQFQSADSILALAKHAQTTLWRYHEFLPKDILATDGDWKRWDTLSTQQVVSLLAPSWVSVRTSGPRILAPRLTADYWFVAPGRPASDTVVPVPGKVNLLCLGGWVSDSRDGLMPQAWWLRRWLTKYGPDRLAVTIVRPVAGYTWGDGIWSADGQVSERNAAHLNQVFAAPPEEAAAWGWLEHAYLRLPVTVAVQVRNSSWLPAPDGRRHTMTRIPFEQFFGVKVPFQSYTDASGFYHDSVYGDRPGEWPGSCAVIDADGRLIFSTQNSGFEIPPVLEWLFERRPGSHAHAIAASTVAPNGSRRRRLERMPG